MNFCEINEAKIFTHQITYSHLANSIKISTYIAVKLIGLFFWAWYWHQRVVKGSNKKCYIHAIPQKRYKTDMQFLMMLPVPLTPEIARSQWQAIPVSFYRCTYAWKWINIPKTQ